MAPFVAAVSLMLMGLPAVTNAKEFLQAPLSQSRRITTEDIKQVLQSELSGLVDSAHLQDVQDGLRSMYATLPKNEHGRLEPATVRYALQRYFMQKYGWHLKGISSSNGVGNSSSTDLLMERAPAYIFGLFEERLHGSGLDLHDLAVFAVTLTDLVHKELAGDVEIVYTALDMPMDSPVSEEGWARATMLYLARYLFAKASAVSLAELAELEKDAIDVYSAWHETLYWLEDLHLADELLQVSRHNPFVESQASFDSAVAFLQEFGHRFSSFQNLGCHSLKEKLLDMEQKGTGRVLLKDFYKDWHDDDTTFTETVPYLRHVGALDESDPTSLSVVIPNYLRGQSNCVGGSGYHLVCCRDECEDLLTHVETEIQSPSASPARIAHVVAALGSDTVHAPRNLSTALLTRLDEIAEHHDGRVMLHGRLFAQWMHHAFPRECPFPHSAGTTNQMRPQEWEDATGLSPEATNHEMIQYTRHAGKDDLAVPWTAMEELVAGHKHRATAGSVPQVSTPLRVAAALALLVSLAVPLSRMVTATTAKVNDGWCKSHLV